MKGLKEYWLLYLFGFSAIGAAAIWIATINSKTFDSPEQKVTVVKAVEAMPTEAERAVELANSAHAIEIRQFRYDDNKRNDSLNKIYERKKDSLFLDMVKRQTVQIEQMKDKIDRIESHH